ncbi:MAG: hypothetical protein A2163_11610 [Actinobacteria bacterium RBG_13_35_12]|nr:MAG: hypothetical protein A2163_11610 [Actinobacteria bacterium RBG_13_35_12]
MTIEQAIKIFLLSKTGITDLVGQRLNYGVLPQGPTYPYLTFFRINKTNEHDIDKTDVYFQFDSWALTYIGAVELADEVRKALQREKGIFSGISIIQGVYQNEDYNYEPDTKLHHIASDFKIVYREL